MASFEIKQGENGELSGKVRIWPGVVGGGLLLGLILSGSSRADDEPSTYDPASLVVVEFSPVDGMQCRGLSLPGSSEVLPATVVCTP